MSTSNPEDDGPNAAGNQVEKNIVETRMDAIRENQQLMNYRRPVMSEDLEKNDAPEWKERFDNTFDFVRSEMGEFEQIHYDNLKKFIAQEKALSYEEGKQRGLIEIDTTETDSTYDEGKKVGFKAGIAKAMEVAEGMKIEDKSIIDIGSEFATPRDYRRTGHNAALSDLLTTLEKL